MSLTGIGFDSSTSGGSFFGKKKSSRLRYSDFQSDSSSEAWGRRFSSGKELPPDVSLELIGVVNIIWPCTILPHLHRSCASAAQLDERAGRQVACRTCHLSGCSPAVRSRLILSSTDSE